MKFGNKQVSIPRAIKNQYNDLFLPFCRGLAPNTNFYIDIKLIDFCTKKVIELNSFFDQWIQLEFYSLNSKKGFYCFFPSISFMIFPTSLWILLS